MMDRGNTKKEELHKRMEERMKKGELGKLKEYKNGEIPRFCSEFFNEWISRIV